MSLPAPFSAIDRAAERLRAALVDPARAERTVLWLLAAYVVVWAAYATMSKWPQGLHPDMTETVAWSRDLSLGYLKHPPLAAWLVAAWFAVFPVAEWSYYLLAALMPASAALVLPPPAVSQGMCPGEPLCQARGPCAVRPLCEFRSELFASREM